MRCFPLLMLICSVGLSQYELELPKPVDELADKVRQLQAKVESLENRLKELETKQPQPTEAEPRAETSQLKNRPHTNSFEAQGIAKPKERDDPPKITLFTRDGCPPCVRWWTENAQALKDKGWLVEKVYVSDGTTPRFRVCLQNRCVNVQGWLSFDMLREIIAGKRQQDYTQKSDGTWLYSMRDSNQSKWSYPGDIRDHLCGEIHQRIAIPKSATKRDLEWYHDGFHDGLHLAKHDPSVLAMVK